MPRTALPVAGITLAGVAAPAWNDGDPDDLNSVVNDGRTVLIVRNDGVVARTLTVPLVVTVDGQTVTPRTYTVPAGATRYLGVFDTVRYGTTMLLNPESSDLQLVALRFGQSVGNPGTGGGTGGGPETLGATATTATVSAASASGTVSVTAAATAAGTASTSAAATVITGGSGTSTLNYTASTAVIPNPARGFFQYTETHYQNDSTGFVPLNAATLAAERTSAGRALVFRYYVMEKFLGVDALDTGWLDLLAADFAAVRAAGCKAVLRFTYSTSGDMSPPYGADPPAARVLGHIAQLADTLNAAADVIEAVEAGFVGMWGEWYYTDNFGDVGTVTVQQGNDRLRIVAAMLDLLDPRVFVLVRYPGVKQGWFG